MFYKYKHACVPAVGIAYNKCNFLNEEILYDQFVINILSVMCVCVWLCVFDFIWLETTCYRNIERKFVIYRHMSCVRTCERTKTVVFFLLLPLTMFFVPVISLLNSMWIRILTNFYSLFFYFTSFFSPSSCTFRCLRLSLRSCSCCCCCSCCYCCCPGHYAPCNMCCCRRIRLYIAFDNVYYA